MQDESLLVVAEHCLAAKEALGSGPSSPLVPLIDLALLEIGRQLAARMRLEQIPDGGMRSYETVD